MATIVSNRPNAGHPVASAIRRIVELSERLPKTKRSALLGKRQGTVSKSPRLQKLHRLRPDRSGVNWQMFQEPKGRPTMIQISNVELEKKFGRKV